MMYLQTHNSASGTLELYQLKQAKQWAKPFFVFLFVSFFAHTLMATCTMSSGGTIGNPQSNCGTYSPSAITNVSGPSSPYGGSYTYKWQKTTDPNTAAGNASNYYTITGANGSTYDPGTISVTSWYRRCAARSACGDFPSSGYSNWVKMTVNQAPDMICEGWIDGVYSVLSDCQISICQGRHLRLSVNPNVSTVNWTGPNGYVANGTNDITLGNATPNMSGQYTATLTQNGCTATKTITVFVNATPNAAISGNLSVCNGQTTTLNANGDGSATWSNGSTAYSINVGAGTYSVTFSNYGCTSTATATVTNLGSTVGGTVSPASGSACGTGVPTPSFSVSGIVGTVARWEYLPPGGGWTNWGGAGSNTSPSGSFSSVGQWKFRAIISSPCGEAASSEAVWNVNAKPGAAISGNLSVCNGQTTTLNANGDGSATWSNGSTAYSINVGAGTYSVTFSNYGCTATATATVTNLGSTVGGTVSPASGSACGSGPSVPTPSLSVSGIVGTVARWEYLAPGGGWTNWGGAGSNTSPSGWFSSVGQWKFRAIISGPCGEVASSESVWNVNALPGAAISGNLSVCNGQTTTLTASGNGSATWSNGSTAYSINVGAGSYSVTFSNYGCTSTATATVTSGSATANISGNLSVCSGQTTTLTASGGGTYAWSNGSTNSSINVGAGTYTVTVTNGSCTASKTVTVTSGSATANISGNLSVCSGQTTTLTASGGGLYSWSNGSNNQTINVGSGTYTVTVTTNGGCTATKTVTVTSGSATANISGNLSVCNGQTTTLTASGGGTYAWSNGSTNPSINVGAGTYTVTVTANGGCTATKTVTVNPIVANLSISTCPSNITLSSTNTSSCEVASWTVPTASSNCGTPILNSNYAPGFCFPIGITNVIYTATLNGETKTCSFTVTVNPPPVIPTITINNVTVNENAGTASLQICISQASASPVTVNYQTSNGTAQFGADYTFTSGTATIPVGQTCTTVTFPILDDNTNEPTELFNVNLTNPNGATIADNLGTVTILDNDAVQNIPTITINDVTVNENAGTASLHICISQASASPVTVNYQTSNGTAQFGVDYTFTSGTATIPAGQLCTTVTFPILDDQTNEPTEVFNVNLSYPNGATIADNLGTVMILDNDTNGGGTPNCDNIAITPGNGQITVSGLNAPIVMVQVFNSSWQQVYNFANAPSGSSQTVPNLPAGAYFVKVTFLTSAWTSICKKEGNFTVTGGGSNLCPDGTPKKTPGTSCNDNNSSTINDVIQSDGCTCVGTTVAPPPSITINNVTVNENVGNATLQICASQAVTNNVTVQFSTSNGTAVSGSDYVNTTNIVNIPAGQTCVTITIPIIDNSVNEPTEVLNVTLSNPVGATLGNSNGTITILDNDTSGGGTPDCNLIGITANSGSISITGLNAPIIMVQVFNASWQQVYTYANAPSGPTINIPNLTSGTYFVKVTLLNASWIEICKKEVNINVTGSGVACDNVTNGGTITGDQTVCNTQAPATIGSSSPATGGTGAIEYIWIFSTVACPNPSAGTTQIIPGANGETYTPGVLTQTTWFLRCARRAGCSNYNTGESNCVKITVSGPCGGGGNTVTCDGITIGSGSGSIVVGGLTAPIIIIQVFDNKWAKVYECLDNGCAKPNNIINGLASGQYFVKVDFLNESWQPICKKEQFITVGSNLVASNAALTFNAYKKGTTSELKWLSNTGEQNDFFVIERSSNGLTDFTPIGEVDGTAMPNETRHFTEIDNNPLKGDNYYRLKLVFKDGFFIYSQVEKLNFPSCEGGSIYPNPASERVFIALGKKAEEGTQVRLINQYGQLIREIKTTDATDIIEFSLDGVINGYYLLQIQAENGRPTTQKVVVESLK